jgi:mono/diheme cytochrome c family protein
MFKGLLLGIIVGFLLVGAAIHLYFATGQAPVATSAAPMPFERKYAHIGLDAYLDKLPHPEPQTPADEKNFLAGADVYKENCAVCHGLPGLAKTAIAEGMYPKPPQLFHGVGVTDDEAWETYWKVENGIRMTGMPGFKGLLNETQIWQVSVLVKNADKISPSVKAALLAPVAPPVAAPADPSMMMMMSPKAPNHP